jgi:hypothetical protein
LNQIAISQHFLESAAEWVCDSYALDIRYLAAAHDGVLKIIDASLVATPLAENTPTSFSLQVDHLVAGQEFFPSLTKTELLQRLGDAVKGEIVANGRSLILPSDSSSRYYSEVPNRDNWLFDLHLQLSGSRFPPSSPSEALAIDQGLRRATPPFDGLSDLCSWLGLVDSRVNGQDPVIKMRINAPVAIILNDTTLDSNRFRLTLHAQPEFDTSGIELAISESPRE